MHLQMLVCKSGDAALWQITVDACVPVIHLCGVCRRVSEQITSKTTAADSDGVTTNSECGVGVSAEFGGDAKAHAAGSRPAQLGTDLQRLTELLIQRAGELTTIIPVRDRQTDRHGMEREGNEIYRDGLG